MSFTSINLHDVAHISVAQRSLPRSIVDRSLSFFTEIVFTDEDGTRVEVTAFSARDAAIPIENATLTDEVPA